MTNPQQGSNGEKGTINVTRIVEALANKKINGHEALSWLIGVMGADPDQLISYDYTRDDRGNCWTKARVKGLTIFLGASEITPEMIDTAAKNKEQAARILFESLLRIAERGDKENLPVHVRLTLPGNGKGREFEIKRSSPPTLPAARRINIFPFPTPID